MVSSASSTKRCLFKADCCNTLFHLTMDCRGRYGSPQPMKCECEGHVTFRRGAAHCVGLATRARSAPRDPSSGEAEHLAKPCCQDTLPRGHARVPAGSIAEFLNPDIATNKNLEGVSAVAVCKMYPCLRLQSPSLFPLLYKDTIKGEVASLS